MADQTFWTKPEDIRIFQKMIDMEDGTHAIRMESYPPKDFSTIDLTGTKRINVDLPYKKELQSPLVATDIGIITHSVIQGFSTGHGGEFHDVKVTPSGALTVEATIQEPVSVQNTQLTPLFVRDENLHGVWGYVAGVDGTPTFPANAYIIQIAVVSPSNTASSFTINGGQVINVPAQQSLTIEPKGLLVLPTIVFSGTASYFVEYCVH